MDFPCPGCGGQLHWKPTAGAMECPYCGTTVDDPHAGSSYEIEEYRLDDAAAAAPKGWGTETRTVSCDGCGAVHDLDPQIAAGSCPFCGSAQIHDAAEQADVLSPESVLPFAIDDKAARAAFRGWLSGLWFRPSSLKSAAQLESLAGVYVPAWSFDARAASDWQAESGEYYYVEEDYEAEEDGKTVTRTRKVRKTRWTQAAGTHTAHYDDWLVQASGGLDQAALKGLLPFSLDHLKPYAATYLSGFRAERYAIGLDEAWGTAEKELGSAERNACRKEVPGDTQRKLAVRTTFSDVRFKHTLLPIWIAAYRYEGQVYRYLVNGHSGKAYGDAPYSKLKIAAFVAAIVLAILGCMGVFGAFGTAGALLAR
jgi:predicted RNA-binding Zn-ribbon protein involved in translation (DUF1610 family)